MRANPDDKTPFISKLTEKLSTTLNYIGSLLIHNEEYVKPFTERTYYEGYLEGRRAALDDNQKSPDKIAFYNLKGLSKEQYLAYVTALYNNLILGDFFYIDKKKYLGNYITVLYRMRHQIQNLQMHDRKLENQRQDLLKKMNDRLQVLRNTDQATLLTSFMKGDDAIKYVENIAQDALEWGKLIGYANGFLYAYEKFGQERFEQAAAELQSLEHRFAKHNLPPETAMSTEEFKKVRGLLLNRLRQYIMEGILTSENPEVYDSYRFTQALREKKDPYDALPRETSKNPLIYRLQHGNFPPVTAPSSEPLATEIL